jgi:phage tail sheath protein FI
MAFQVSPGVVTREIDLTNVIPAVSTSIGATVVAGLWGPVEEIVTITNEKELVDTFGVPVDATAAYFFNAAAFLKYGNNLKVSRAVASGALNATAGTTSAGAGLLIKNRADYEDNYSSFEAAESVGVFAAKYPGTFGNFLRVSYVSNAASFNAWDTTLGYSVKDQFNGAPGTSSFVAAKGGSADEIHFVVIDDTGYITGVKGTVIEKFSGLSQAKDAKNFDGSTNYYKDVINTQSKYVWVTNALASLTNVGAEATTTFTTVDTPYNKALAGGLNAGVGSDLDVGDIDTAFQVFNDAETVDVNLLIGAPTLDTGTDYADGVTQANNLLAIAENRKDLVAFISPPMTATVGAGSNAKTNVIEFADQLTSSSYGFLDSTALKVYDKYNDVYRWIPAAGHMAGLCANTDEVSDPWFPPAGYTRGQILGITKVAFNPKKAERDDLYKKRVNPIVSFPGEGTILFGDKTLQAKPSAFDRINVRRLFIILEKAIATAAKYQLFELNDEFTRAMFRNMTEPFLREIKGRRGVTDFKVVCDETNNTGEIIDSNQFVADIYIKPARSINFINLNFIATRTGVDFSEIGG